MATIAGASQYRTAAILANTQGLAAQSPSLLNSGSTDIGASLLSAGKNLAVSGFGISSSARALNDQLLNNSDYRTLLSLGAGTDATVEGLQQEILALRAGLSENQLAPSLRGTEVDTEA